MRAFIDSKDRASYSELYNRYFDSLSKYIGWLTADFERGKDIAQCAFLQVYKTPESFDTSRKFNLWLFAIAKNIWKNDARNKRTRQRHQKNSARIQEVDIEIYGDEANTQSLRLEQIKKAVEKLPTAQKEAFILKYSNNLTIKEISEVCDCNEGTVKSRLFYAIKGIREQIM